MLTIVLLLSLLVSFLSIVMTVGNALNTTSLAKFWALLATASVFVTTFIFIVDSFDLVEAREGKNGFATEVNANTIEHDPSENSTDQQPAINDNANIDSMNHGDIQLVNQTTIEFPIQPNQGATNVAIPESKVARMMLLDLFAKRFSGNVEGLTSGQRDWVMQNMHLYPADTDEKLNQTKAIAAEVRNLDQVYRNINMYKEGIIHGTGVVLDKVVDEGAGIQEMQVNLVGPDGGVYVLYYPSVVSIKNGDWVQFYGTPITGKTLQSDFFGNINSLLVYANYIGK